MLASVFGESALPYSLLRGIREGLPVSREPALLTSAGRMPERSQHRVSEGQDDRSERPATGHGQPQTAGNLDMQSCVV
jgi:hypothetical protein